jgi:hypothetical protein
MFGGKPPTILSSKITIKALIGQLSNFDGITFLNDAEDYSFYDFSASHFA